LDTPEQRQLLWVNARVFTFLIKLRRLLNMCLIAVLFSLPCAEYGYRFIGSDKLIYYNFFFQVRCQEHNGNNLIIKWQTRTFKPWNVATFTTVSWWSFLLYKNAVKQWKLICDFWILHFRTRTSKFICHHMLKVSCIVEKYLHIHLAVSWSYHNKRFMHYWLLLNRTQHIIRNCTGCFHNETYQFCDLVSYRTPCASPQIKQYYDYFKNLVWLCSGLFRFLWYLIQ
jgi:hypothetical protein